MECGVLSKRQVISCNILYNAFLPENQSYRALKILKDCKDHVDINIFNF